MKKRFVAVGLIILLAVAIIAAFLIGKNNTGTEDMQTNSTTSKAFKNAQIGLTVDSWLKIIEIDEYYGRLAVIVENVSETDVEYAVLTVKTKSGTLTFNVSALLSGTKAALLCNQEVACDPNESYTAWQTKDMILFEEPRVMNEDKLEINVLDGSISIRNISGEDIDSDIYIYYKDKDNDILNGSITYRACAKGGIKADSLTYIKAPELNQDNCRVIFIDYDN